MPFTMFNATNSNDKKAQTQDASSSTINNIAVSELTLSHLSEVNHNDILITAIKKGFRVENQISLNLQHRDNFDRFLLNYKGPKLYDQYSSHDTIKVNEILLKKAIPKNDEPSLGDIHDGCWDILHIFTKKKNDCDYLFKTAIKEKYTIILTILLEITNANNSSRQVVLYLHGINGTPMHRAVIEKDIKTIQTLLDYKLDINAKDKAGWTSLLVAVDSEISNIVDLLISNGADINLENNQFQTPLHYAAERNNSQILNSLLKNQVKLNEKDKNGQTPLFYAVAAKHLNVIDTLLKNGADYKLRDLFDYTPFHLAAKQQSLDIVEVFLKNNVDADILNSHKQTPLFYLSKKQLRPQSRAVYKELYPKIIHALLQKGANINFQDSQGRTPLHAAVIYDNVEFLNALFKYNADVSIQDKLGKNILHLACEYPNNKCTQAVLNLNIDINTVDIVGRTALYVAVEAKNYGAVELLLKKNPNINMSNKHSKTPLHCAIESECLPIIELLLKNKADVNLQDTLGKTALHVASTNSNIKNNIIKSILNSTNDINLKDNEGRTAAHFAALYHNFNTFEYLLEENAHVNAKDSQGNTPLHLVMKPERKYRACFKCVKVLLNYKADINAVDNNFTSPLHLACINKNAEIVKYLIENGADSNMRDKFGNTVFHFVCKLELNGISFWIEDIKKHTRDTLNVLVEKSILVNCVDKFGKSPLHYAVEGDVYFMNELLLNIGADINIVDVDHNSAFDILIKQRSYFYPNNSPNESINIYKKHIVKMKVMKLEIRKRSLDRVYEVDDEERLKWIQSYELNCSKEIDLMKTTNLHQSYITYYDFLKKKPHNGVNYTRNQNIVKSIQSNKLTLMFPIYGYFLKCHLREVQHRRYLYEEIQEWLKLCMFKKLPTACMWEIFSYLDNSDLSMLLKGMEPDVLEQ